jgi:hypothetical protein
MQAITNNPYRTIGLLAGASLKDQTRQANRLKQFVEAEQEVTDDFSFPALGKLNRTANSINDAVAKLNLNNDRINAALFWFYNGSHVDEASFDSIKDSNLQNAISIWEKRTFSGEISQSNHSAFQNLSTLKLLAAFDSGALNTTLLEDGILLKLKFLESDFVKDFKALTTDETFRTTKKDLELFFLNQVQTEIEKNYNFSSQKFIDIINKQSFTAKEDFLKGFAQKPIEIIEKQVESCKARRKIKKDVIVAGTTLYKEAKSNLETLKSILGTSNLKFQTISDKVSDEVLQCGIQLFNDFRTHETYDPGKPAMDLFVKAKTLAIGSIARQRCQENTENLQNWINEKPERDKQNKIKVDFDALLTILEEFENRSETIENAKSLINRTKPHLNNIKTILGSNDEIYLGLSTRVAAQAQSYVIGEVNESQQNLDYKLALDKYGTINRIKTVLRNAWDAITLIATLEMEYDFKTNRFYANKEALKGLCNQLGVNVSGYSPSSANTATTTYRPATNTNTQSDFDFAANAWWILGLVGLIIGAIAGGGGGAVIGAIIGGGIGSKFSK